MRTVFILKLLLAMGLKVYSQTPIQDLEKVDELYSPKDDYIEYKIHFAMYKDRTLKNLVDSSTAYYIDGLNEKYSLIDADEMLTCNGITLIISNQVQTIGLMPTMQVAHMPFNPGYLKENGLGDFKTKIISSNSKSSKSVRIYGMDQNVDSVDITYNTGLFSLMKVVLYLKEQYYEESNSIEKYCLVLNYISTSRKTRKSIGAKLNLNNYVVQQGSTYFPTGKYSNYELIN